MKVVYTFTVLLMCVLFTLTNSQLTSDDLEGKYWSFGSEYSWHGMMYFGKYRKVSNYNDGGIAYW